MAFTPDVGYPAINREKSILRIRIMKDNPGLDEGVGFIRGIQGGDAINMVPRQCFATVDTSLLTREQVRWLEESVTAAGRVSAVRSEEDPKLYTLETVGKSAHGASPEMGINAVLLMTEWLEKLNDVRNEGKSAVFADGVIGSGGSFLKYINKALGAGTDGLGLGIHCRYNPKACGQDKRERHCGQGCGSLAFSGGSSAHRPPFHCL